MMLMSGIYTFRKLVLLVLGICWLNTLGAAEPEKVVYKVDIKDEIGSVASGPKIFRPGLAGKGGLYFDSYEYLRWDGRVCRFFA